MPATNILSLSGSINLYGSITASAGFVAVSGSIQNATSASFANRSLAADRIKTINVGGAGTFYPLMGSSFFGDVTTHTIESPAFRYDSATSQLAVFSISSSFTGSLRGTAATASYWSGSVKHAESASFATSASWAPTPETASYAVTASYTLPVVLPYTIYNALLTYNAGGFTVRQIQNTLGDITWSNPANGQIRATLAAAFASTDIFIRSSAFGNGTNTYIVTGVRGTSSFLTFNITKLDGTQSSTPYFANLPIEIHIY